MRISDHHRMRNVILIALESHSHGADWKPAQGPLATRWTHEVTPANAWREYPRPQLVRKEWLNLNGLWQYAITDGAAERPTTYAGEILVPFAVESALSGVMKPVSPQQQLWYQRRFEAPSLAEGQRLLLHFGAVDWQCTVWMNDQQVGRTRGWLRSFHHRCHVRGEDRGPMNWSWRSVTPPTPDTSRKENRFSSRKASCIRPSRGSGRPCGWKLFRATTSSR